jgi:hypothetical protein
MNNCIVESIFKHMNCFFIEYVATEVKKVEPEDIEHLCTILESIWVFSIIWSLCCTVDKHGRKIFDTFVRDRLK